MLQEALVKRVRRFRFDLHNGVLEQGPSFPFIQHCSLFPVFFFFFFLLVIHMYVLASMCNTGNSSVHQLPRSILSCFFFFLFLPLLSFLKHFLLVNEREKKREDKVRTCPSTSQRLQLSSSVHIHTFRCPLTRVHAELHLQAGDVLHHTAHLFLHQFRRKAVRGHNTAQLLQDRRRRRLRLPSPDRQRRPS